MLEKTLQDRDFERRLHGKPLSRELEARLIRRAQDGDMAARELVISANAPAMAKLAGNLRAGAQVSGRLEYADILQVGLTALVRSVDRFEPDRGTSFLGYVWDRARSDMYKAKLKNETSLHMSEAALRAMKRVREASADIRAAGRVPTPEEVAEMAGISLELARETMEMSAPPVSMDGSHRVRDDGEEFDGDRLEFSDARAAVGELGATAATPEDLALLELRYSHGLPAQVVADMSGETRAQIVRMEAAAKERLAQPQQMPAYVTSLAAERRSALIERARQAAAAGQRAAANPVSHDEIATAPVRVVTPLPPPPEIPAQRVREALAQLEPRWHARLGVYSCVAVERGDDAGMDAVRETFGIENANERVTEGFRLLRAQLAPASDEFRNLAQFREVMREPLAEQFRIRTETIAAMPEAERTVLDSLYLQGSSISSTAGALGVDRGKVARVHEAALPRLEIFEAMRRARRVETPANAALQMAL